MKNRFSKIVKPIDGRCVMLAVDHGYFLGPTEKLENPKETIKPLLPFADSIMLTRGILRTSIPPQNNIPIVLRVSGGSSIIGEDLSKEDIVTSIEEAIKLNASCATSEIALNVTAYFSFIVSAPANNLSKVPSKNWFKLPKPELLIKSEPNDTNQSSVAFLKSFNIFS